MFSEDWSKTLPVGLVLKKILKRGEGEGPISVLVTTKLCMRSTNVIYEL